VHDGRLRFVCRHSSDETGLCEVRVDDVEFLPAQEGSKLEKGAHIGKGLDRRVE
jgi:hypothetical protein